MVIAHHLVWTAYGWWLPNDPRGSMSKYIDRDVLSELGELHYGRKRVQPESRTIREFYERAKSRLKDELLTFTSEELVAIGSAFAETMHRERYTCYACALMHDHVHLVIRKHRDLAEDMILKLQISSVKAVRALGRRDSEHPVWGGSGWKVFLDSPADIRRTIKYVEDNPIKARIPAQKWEFVVAYDCWPFHKRNP